MKIGSKDYRVAVFSLMQEKEFETARISLSGLFAQLDETTQMILLLNGPENRKIADYFRRVPFVQFYCAERNLGVAGGRNRLVRLACGWGADIMVSYDNDMVPQREYLRRICTFLVRISSREKVGIVAPALVNAHKCRRFWSPLFQEGKAALDRGELVSDAFTFAPTDLRAFIRREYPKSQSDVFYHLGVNNWRVHYLRSHLPPMEKIHIRLSERFSCIPPCRTYKSTVRTHSPEIHQLILGAAGPIPTDALPGGVHCFFLRFIRDMTGYDNSFNPFGFEDSDLCVRALQKGYRNYLIPSLLLIHDIASRNESRDFAVVSQTRGKMKRIFLNKHVPRLTKRLLLFLDALLLAPVEIIRHGLYLRKMNKVGGRDIFHAVANYLSAVFGMA